MTDKEPRLCDCPEPCGCYAEGYDAGKDKAFFEMEMGPEGRHSRHRLRLPPCRVKRACLRKAMALMASDSLALLDNGHRN